MVSAGLLKVVSLGGYIIIMIGIGYWATRAQSGVSDWLVTGNRLGVWVMALSMIATVVSGFGFIGAPGLAYALGWPPVIWIAMGLVGLPLTFILIGKPMRILMERYDCLTVPDLLTAMYGGASIRIISSIIILVGYFGYMVVQWTSGARAFEGLFPVTYLQGLAIMVVIVALYTIGGGVLAASYTDALQMILMMGAGVVVTAIGLSTLGGFGGLNSILYSADPNLTNVVNPSGMPFDLPRSLGFFIMFAAIGGYVAASIRVFFTESVSTLKWGGVVVVTAHLVGSGLIWLSGMYYRAFQIQGRVEPVSTPDLVFPAFIDAVLPPVIAAIIVAAVIAAIMSTIDSVIVIAASALVHDLYEEARGLELSDKDSLKYHRIGSVIIIAITVLLSFNPPRFIGLLAASVLGFVIGSFFAPMVLGTRWGKATKEGAIASMLVGFVVGFGGDLFFQFTQYSPTFFDAKGWAVILSLLTMIIVSKLTYKEPLDIWTDEFSRSTKSAD